MKNLIYIIVGLVVCFFIGYFIGKSNSAIKENVKTTIKWEKGKSLQIQKTEEYIPHRYS